MKWHNALVVALEIHINREADIAIHEQIAAQIVLHIGSGALLPGDALPSMRALARRLGIHRNTVTRAYGDAVLTKLVVKRRGSRFVVRDPKRSKARTNNELDEFVDSAIRAARQHGYSPQQLIGHLRDHLLAEPPDHILLASNEAGMRVLMSAELSAQFDVPVHASSTVDLLANHDLMLGALLVTAPGNLPILEAMIPAERPAIPVIYSNAAEHLSRIQGLVHPSLIVVASISEYFLEMACSVLAPAAANLHSLRSVLISPTEPVPLGSSDLVFCDTCAYSVARIFEPQAEVVRHQLISPACLDQIQSALDGRTWTNNI